MNDLEKVCRTTAETLAADRATKFLPVSIALILFIVSIVLAFVKTATGKPGPGNFINLEAHSIAFSVPFLWLVPAVTLSSSIGVSQTEESIPRTLEQFQDRVRQLLGKDSLSNIRGIDLADANERTGNGGIYSWQPKQWQGIIELKSKEINYRETGPSQMKRKAFAASSVFIVFLCILAAWTISWNVPPNGWVCRQWAQLAIFLVWFVSFALDLCLRPRSPVKETHSRHFWAVFFKDSLAAILTVFVIAITQWGVFNRCECLTHFGKTGLKLPQDPEVLADLQDRLWSVYAAVTSVLVIIQIAFTITVCWRFRHALRVYLQRDDGGSNFEFKRRGSRPGASLTLPPGQSNQNVDHQNSIALSSVDSRPSTTAIEEHEMEGLLTPRRQEAEVM